MSKIGDIVRFNGTPDNIGSYDKQYINDRLNILSLYEIIGIERFLDRVWCCVKSSTLGEVWAPEESFSIVTIKEIYGLR